LARGEDVELYLHAMEGAASEGGLIPEQVWDDEDVPELELFKGRPSGSAMPLVWAHAEYVKLLYSAAQGRVFETPTVVHDRYRKTDEHAVNRVFWEFNHQRREWSARDQFLRVAVNAPAQLVYTRDNWAHVEQAALRDSGLGMYFADVPLVGCTQVEFTFFWTEVSRWENRNFEIHLEEEDSG
jgi:glucoamylase